MMRVILQKFIMKVAPNYKSHQENYCLQSEKEKIRNHPLVRLSTQLLDCTKVEKVDIKEGVRWDLIYLVFQV